MQSPYRTNFNGRLDRLSSLIDRLRVHVSDNGSSGPDVECATLWICKDPAQDLRLILNPANKRVSSGLDKVRPRADESVLVSTQIEISGVGKRLFTALPVCLSIDLAEDPSLSSVVMPLIEEVMRPRCGGQAVFQRLCEVVVIRLLRHALEGERVDTGLLNGLSDSRVAQALVAIHEAPGENWTLERLAEVAGMSRTQFAVTFKDLIGSTPMMYLSNWRLDIARDELAAGRQVKSVANMCGFSSAASFSRAFAKRYGAPPRRVRQIS
ncbi:helix-turn-helix domain-containing protein [Roseibium sp.]|uniref:helix-turn-helix domain-containing protein n=1 Tax=Roseibium sp. TaxID=1936156 RepID=UPI003B52A2F6